MKRLTIIGLDYFEFMEAIEKVNLATRQKITFEDLVELEIFFQNIVPDDIKKSNEEFEKLGEALTALSFGKHKVVINEIPQVNPHERKFKNKRKW